MSRFNVLSLQETSQGIAELVAHVEVYDLTVGLWEQRVAVVIGVSTVTARTKQAINKDAVLVYANRTVGVGQPATSKVANTAAL